MDLRITDVQAYVIHETGVQAYRFRNGLPPGRSTRDDVWLRVLTNEGIEGWSFLPHWGIPAAALATRHLRDLAIGANPLNKEDLWHRVWELDRMEELPLYALGMLDVALWDITGKVAGLPLHKIVGGYRETVPAYASLHRFEDEAEFIAVVDQCLAMGFKAIKLHGWGDLRKDADLCARIRAHVPEPVHLMFDAMGAFTPHEAMWLGRALEDSQFYWYEEPVREFAIGAYRQLTRDLDIPIVLEATDGCHYRAAELLSSDAADIIQSGVEYHGVTGALRIASVADAFGRTVEFHTGGLPHAHLCCAVRNTTFYESVVLSNPVQKEPGVDSEGNVRAPEGPGIG